MKIPIYLGGSSHDLPRVQHYAALLDASGLVTITHRWWESVAKAGVGADARMTRDAQREIARQCDRGMHDADIFWLMYPDSDCASGVLVELGIALTRKSYSVIVTGRNAHKSVFAATAGYRDSSDELGFVETLRLARLMGGAS